MVAAATSATVMSASAHTATAATVKAATSASTAVTATAMLRERCRRGKQRHGSDCAEQNLKKSGPIHVCYLHPTSTQEVRAARTSRPYYIN